MISVDEALDRILSNCAVLNTENIAITASLGRVLAQDIASRRTQPPRDVSAMDGYAVRAEDIAVLPASVRLVGQAPAGGAYEGTVGSGEAVRIFTGGPVPAGADAIVLQEDTDVDGDVISVHEVAIPEQHIRQAGIDFSEGDVLLKKGRKLSPADVGLLASMNWPEVPVTRQPKIALMATGDELVRPGEGIGPNQIVSSNAYALAALIETHGGVAIDLGIARDDEEAIQQLASEGSAADVLVTMGGASVGDHDLVQSALADIGLEVDFWKIAMRPGKPLIFGRLGESLMLGLPGNPVSSMVCAILYLVPMIRAMLGIDPASPPPVVARLGADIGANKSRQDYIRAQLVPGEDGVPVVSAFSLQDSSVLRLFAHAGALIVRPPDAPAAPKGALVQIIPL